MKILLIGPPGGGKGTQGMNTKEADVVTNLFVTNTHTPLLFFSSDGLVYKLKTWRLPQSGRNSKGKAIINLLPINSSARITTILPVEVEEETWKDLQIFFATSTGNVRRNALSDFTNVKANGKIAMKLPENTTLVGAQICKSDNDNGDIFYNRLNNYVHVNKYAASSSYSDIDFFLEELRKYDIVIVGLHYSNQNFWDKHVVLEKEKLLLSKLCSQNKVLVNIFGHPQLLNFIPDDVDGVVLSYQNSNVAQDLTAQLNFGSISASGRLPVSTNKFDCGSGLDLESTREFEFVMPLEVGVNQDTLLRIDTLVHASIKDKVMPGCQIVASRYGKVFYNKTFGYHTYDSVRLVGDSDLYDIASITKIASAAPIMMEMVDRKLIKLHKKLGRYSDIPLLYNDKRNLKIIDIFTHQAQLFPWIPFWQSFTNEDSLDMSIFSKSRYLTI